MIFLVHKSHTSRPRIHDCRRILGYRATSDTLTNLPSTRRTAEGESNRIGWTKVMLDANKALVEYFVIPSVLKQLKDLAERAERGVFIN